MASLELDGFAELENMVQQMTITVEDQKRAMKKAIEVPKKEVENNTPVGKTKRLKKSLKCSVKIEDLAVVGILKYGVFYDMFEEFGTSKSKAHMGFFERSINKTENEVINKLANELLK